MLGATVAGGLCASTESSKKLGVALVGLGYYSTDLLAPALQHTQQCYLSAIVTGTKAKESQWASQYGIKNSNIYNYDNFDDIKNNADIDIVYVVLPNSMHKEFTIRAAQAGKHVICEKPMALNAIECEEMILACKKNNVRLTIGYRLHFEPYTQHIMSLGKSLPFGDIKYIQAAAEFRTQPEDFPNSWRLKKSMGGGWMMDMGIYAIQAARYSKQMEPVAVTAQTANSRPQYFKEVTETTTAQLYFPDGSLAQITGTAATFVGNLTVAAADGQYYLSPFWTYEGIRGGTLSKPFDFPLVHQQVTQLDEMAISIRDNLPMRVEAEEGLKDMRVMDAIFRSIALGGKKVII
nr:Gfo/Idh/MocA family oxidoreductase [Marinibactrum halimedae]